MIKIGLDAAHGGRDPGAVYQGRKESVDVLALGLALAKTLRSYGVMVGESRTTDIFVPLQQRAKLSNERGDDYFISIHRNAFQPETAHGVETYVHPKANPHAVSLARRIQNGLRNLGFTDRGVKMANFQVLRETQAPAVLVEVGFIDHTKDNLRFDTKRERIVEMLAGAILEQVGMSRDVGPVELSLDDAVEVLADHGIIQTPDYWRQHAVPEETVRGEYAALLIQRMADVLWDLCGKNS